jgi:predicted NodU family carbamoyl transferase
MKIVATSLAHDSSACFLQDGEIKYWNKQERLSRIKRQSVPFRPLLEIERIFDLSDVDFYVSTSPFQQLGDDDISEAAFFNWYSVGDPFFNYFRSVHPHCRGYVLGSHHLAHAANAFYGSGFDSAYVLVVDRVGSIFIDRHARAAVGAETETLLYCRYPCSFEVVYRNPPQWLGITGVYCMMSEKLGIGDMENGKTMALAAYGKDRCDAPFFRGYLPASPRAVMAVTDGRFLTRLTLDPKFREQVFSDALPAPGKDEDLAHKVQKETSNAILRLIEERVDAGKCENLCFTGGHAHNCLLNYQIANRFPKLNFYPDPLPDDSGTSLGGAKYWWYKETQSTVKMPLVNIYDCGLAP